MTALKRVVKDEAGTAVADSPKEASTRLGNYMVSSVALSLHQILEMYKIAAQIEQATYQMQQNTIRLMSDLTVKTAKFTYEAGHEAACAMRLQGVGSLVGGVTSTLGAGMAAKSFTESTAKIAPVQKEIEAINTNKTTLQDALNSKTHAETALSSKPDVALDREQVKSATQETLAKNEKLAAADAKDFANTSPEEAKEAERTLDKRHSDKAREKESIERERDVKIQWYNALGTATSGLLQGTFQTAGAQAKEEEAKDEELKTYASTSQQISQRIIEGQGQGISGQDSMRQAIYQAQIEMGASNKRA